MPITTRTRGHINRTALEESENIRAKRCGSSPGSVIPKAKRQRDRAPFGDITNALNSVLIDSSKKQKSSQSHIPLAHSKSQVQLPGIKQKNAPTKPPLDTISGKSSCLLPDERESPYITAPDESPTLEEDGLPMVCSQGSSSSGGSEDAGASISTDDESESATGYTGSNKRRVKSLVETYIRTPYDQEQVEDPFQLPHYAQDVFDYYRRREVLFRVGSYLDTRQTDFSPQMRAILVDWMVEIQENFELNHETLYQAVKIVDLYLDRVFVKKENLQLIGSAALFLCAKFDERAPPVADDFVYICDDAYSREQIISTEMALLKNLEFDIGMPLSYRFLRRFAKATKASMDILTLARYILESSLLYYDFVSEKDSLIAAASFLLSLRMTNPAAEVEDLWTPEHAFYSGYTLPWLNDLMWRLNKMLICPPVNRQVRTVKEKYSHEVFHGVAKIPPLPQPKA